MNGTQKIIVFGFLVFFLLLITLGIVASGVFRKKIEVLTFDEKKQISAIQKFLEERGVVISREGNEASLEFNQSGKVYLENKTGLPWVVYSRGPDSDRFSNTARYTVIEFANTTGFQGFVGVQRYNRTQQYTTYFESEFGWDLTQGWERMMAIFDSKNNPDEVVRFMDRCQALFEKSPTADPILVVANSEYIRLYSPFWPISREQFDYVYWSIHRFVPTLK
jgi:hypothetical protein